MYYKEKRFQKINVDLLGTKMERYMYRDCLGRYFVNYYRERMEIDPVSFDYIKPITSHTLQDIVRELHEGDTKSETHLRYVRSLYSKRGKMLETFYPEESVALLNKIEELTWDIVRYSPYAKINKNI